MTQRIGTSKKDSMGRNDQGANNATDEETWQ
jgi:hypothetical protein